MKPSLSGAGSVNPVIINSSSENTLACAAGARGTDCCAGRLTRRTRIVTTVAVLTKTSARSVITAIFVLDQVIKARVPFTSIAVVAVVAAVALTIRPAGAAGAAFAQSTVMSIAAGTATPR